MKIAALLTCFNRREKTIHCLRSLFNILPECNVYLVDDQSTDGTKETVNKEFPQVHIIMGTGNLFWSKGMYTAWKEAIKGNYDYYLWLNDDIELYPFFFKELMECNQWGGGNCIISGLIENFDHTRILYGGSNSQKRLIAASDIPQSIHFMNGNVVLIPSSVVSTIGIIDSKYHHDLGDVDYGLTAIEHGIKVLSTRKAVAAGYSNNFCRVRKWGTTLKERLKKLNSPLGSPPSINFYYRKKHFGILNASIYYVYLYFINILPDNIIKLIYGNTYIDK